PGTDRRLPRAVRKPVRRRGAGLRRRRDRAAADETRAGQRARDGTDEARATSAPEARQHPALGGTSVEVRLAEDGDRHPLALLFAAGGGGRGGTAAEARID